MNQVHLNEFLSNKAKHQAILRDRKKELEELDVNLSTSKISRSFKNMYYIVKRLVLLVFALLFVFGGVFYLFNPSGVIKNEKFKEKLIRGYKIIYIADNLKDGIETSSDVINNIYNKRDSMTLANFTREINGVVDERVEDKIIFIIRVLSFITILLGLSFLYISRLTKKIKQRNKLISKADSLTQNILRDYQLTIEEEEKELQLLKDLVQNRASTA